MRNYYNAAKNYLRNAFTPHDNEDKILQETLNITKGKFNTQTKSRQKAALDTKGFEPYYYEEEKTRTGKTKIKISHPVGQVTHTLRQIQTSWLAEHPEYDENVIENWVPHGKLAAVDPDTARPLTAAEIQNKIEYEGFFPTFFVNPMQDLDYIVYEAILKNTIVGAINNALTKFIVGTGFRPELELINPSDDPDKDAKLIAENHEIVDKLRRIDYQISQDEDENEIDVHFIDKIAALVDTTNAYNRAALIFGYEKPVEIDGILYKQIPTSLKFAHPRDLGIIQVSQNTWRIKSVQWRHTYYMVPARDMIYLWNPLVTAKYHDAWLYGGSMIAPMIDASRVIRKNIGVNFPAMAEATWAGMYIMTIKPQGKEPGEKQRELEDIAQGMVRGGPNILMEDPADVGHHQVDFSPKIKEFQELTESLIRYCVACFGLPHSMFYDESQSNRSTMLGKIQLAIETAINPRRDWIGRSISDQWYQRWFRLLYKDKPELLKQFRIKMVFDDLHVEQWSDRIEAVNELDARKTLSDKDDGELAGIKNYAGRVVPGAQVTPGGRGGKIKFGDEKGNSFEIKKSYREL